MASSGPGSALVGGCADYCADFRAAPARAKRDKEVVRSRQLLQSAFGEKREEVMEWLTYVAYFFGGVFLVNAVPHFTNGVSGRQFPTPFAVPLGKGQSSPTVNVLWGSFNLVVGCLLVGRVGEFHMNRTSEILAVGVGGLLMALMLARLFERICGRQLGGESAGHGGSAHH
jgi:hypothetical protein